MRSVSIFPSVDCAWQPIEMDYSCVQRPSCNAGICAVFSPWNSPTVGIWGSSDPSQLQQFEEKNVLYVRWLKFFISEPHDYWKKLFYQVWALFKEIIQGDILPPAWSVKHVWSCLWSSAWTHLMWQVVSQIFNCSVLCHPLIEQSFIIYLPLASSLVAVEILYTVFSQCLYSLVEFHEL